MMVGSNRPRFVRKAAFSSSPLLDPDVVVSPTNVELGEVFGSPKLVDEF